MHRNGRTPSIGVAILDMRTALTNDNKAQSFESGTDLLRLQNFHGVLPVSGERQILGTDKFRFKNRISILEQHGDYLPQILSQFVECLSLRMGSRESRNISDQKTCGRVPFNYSLKIRIHNRSVT